MYTKLKNYFKANPAAMQFAMYTFFCVTAGLLETAIFMVLNYILPAKGINAPVKWFIFSYPTEAGGQGAFIAFLASAIIGQALKFITNFKKTFKSTTNIWASALGFAILSIVIIVVIHTYLGGVLNTALCKIFANTELAGTIAKLICQFLGYLVTFPVNKYVLMRVSGQDEPTAEEEAISSVKDS